RHAVPVRPDEVEPPFAELQGLIGEQVSRARAAFWNEGEEATGILRGRDRRPLRARPDAGGVGPRARLCQRKRADASARDQPEVERVRRFAERKRLKLTLHAGLPALQGPRSGVEALPEACEVAPHPGHGGTLEGAEELVEDEAERLLLL